MPKKLAIDWDETELRMVAAQCSGSSVKVTDAVVMPIQEGNVNAALKSAIESRGLGGTDTLVAIGRGKAELRELQLPPVPDDELPDMVRFQAIRSFATAGERAVVDYLVTRRSERGVEMIAAAIGPAKLKEVRDAGEAAGLSIKRISLRPLAAAALYLIDQNSSGDTVLIDLLADDAEIVVARDGKVIFVRTVRMPAGESARPKALAGELRRSLVACGATGAPDRVVLWGREAVHAADKTMLAEASGSTVQVLDPFTLVDVDRKAKEDLPDHLGRLAPLVGLLAADDAHADRLVDFLNPRQRVEAEPNRIKNALLVAVPLVAAAVLAFFLYNHLRQMDGQISELRNANAAMKPQVDAATTAVARTETIDQFLDGDVNWLNELRRLADQMPPAEQMIVRNISGSADPRNGGGRLQVAGAVTNPAVIDEFEVALRDEFHRVVGEGAQEQPSEDEYRWGFTESITIDGNSIRNDRYTGIAAAMEAAMTKAESAEPSTQADTPTQDDRATQDEAAAPAEKTPDSDAEPQSDAAEQTNPEGDPESPFESQPSPAPVDNPIPTETPADSEVQA